MGTYNVDKADIAKYKKCEICGADMGKIDFDTPVYCTSCIDEMENRSMTPEQYKQFRELKETIKK